MYENLFYKSKYKKETFTDSYIWFWLNKSQKKSLGFFNFKLHVIL